MGLCKSVTTYHYFMPHKALSSSQVQCGKPLGSYKERREGIIVSFLNAYSCSCVHLYLFISLPQVLANFVVQGPSQAGPSVPFLSESPSPPLHMPSLQSRPSGLLGFSELTLCLVPPRPPFLMLWPLSQCLSPMSTMPCSFYSRFLLASATWLVRPTVSCGSHCPSCWSGGEFLKSSEFSSTSTAFLYLSCFSENFPHLFLGTRRQVPILHLCPPPTPAVRRLYPSPYH